MENKLIVLAVHSYSRAVLIQSQLKDEGIDCILYNVNMIQPDASADVEIKVKEKDIKKALDIYRKFMLEIGAKVKDMKEYGNKKEEDRIKKILVPVDFSDHSRHAARFALHYASRVNAEILLLNAYYSPDLQTIPYDETFGIEGTFGEYLNQLRDTAKQEILRFLDELRKTAKKDKLDGILIDYFIVKGSLDDAIVFAGESYSPDLIIMGARGKNKRKDDPIGSTTARILTKAKGPVLVIPEDTDIKEFLSVRKVIYATDYDESDFHAVKKLIRLVNPFGMEIICTHIGKEHGNQWEQMKMEGLKTYFRQSYPEVKVSCNLIRHDDVITGLDEYISKHHVSVIALTTHKRNLIAKLFNPSITRKMFFHTRIPLLVFHS